MSKLFDALRRADPAGADLDADERSAAPAPVPEAVPVVAPAAAEAIEAKPEAAPGPNRTVSLRVSALSPIFPFEEGQTQAAEQYRIIRTKLLHHPAGPRVVVISSPSPGDGKTVTAVNVAAALALKENTSTLLIDADLRRPSVARLLGLAPSPGLADVLTGRGDAVSAIARVEEFPNLSVLTAGEAKAPAELLDSERWRQLIGYARKHFRYVVLDATPVASVADYELVQLVSDGVVLVVRPDHTDRKMCTQALDLVPKQKLVGVVLNCVENWFLWKSHGYGYYGYYGS
jgi:capsular exopolysaccharide synthesis family protein